MLFYILSNLWIKFRGTKENKVAKFGSYWDQTLKPAFPSSNTQSQTIFWGIKFQTYLFYLSLKPNKLPDTCITTHSVVHYIDHYSLLVIICPRVPCREWLGIINSPNYSACLVPSWVVLNVIILLIWIVFFVQVRLRTEALCIPSSTPSGFKLMTSRSWQYAFHVTETPALTTWPSMVSRIQVAKYMCNKSFCCSLYSSLPFISYYKPTSSMYRVITYNEQIPIIQHV